MCSWRLPLASLAIAFAKCVTKLRAQCLDLVWATMKGSGRVVVQHHAPRLLSLFRNERLNCVEVRIDVLGSSGDNSADGA